MMRRMANEPIRSILLATSAVLAFLAASLWQVDSAPAEARNPHGVAVIVGNKDYRHRDIPDVSFAHRDADAFRRYVVDVLGFAPEHIIDLRDATRAQLLHTFGRKQDDVSDLWAKLLPDRMWDVVVFYSGHGVPGLQDGKGYLLPVDVSPRAAQEEGYPIDLLYEKLGGLSNVRSVQVYVDACFSGASDGGPLVRSASPVVVRPALPQGLADKVTAVSASGADQIASWDEKSRHGLFTHHLLDALYGKGDADGDKKVTAKEVGAYLDGYMTRAAWLQHRRKQNASVLGAPGMVLASAPAGGFPKRPSPGGEAQAGKEEETKEVAKLPVVEREAVLDRKKKAQVQRGLASLGLYKGFIDGDFGPKTREAIRSWQDKKGYGVTGRLTKKQANALADVGGQTEVKKESVKEKTLANKKIELNPVNKTMIMMKTVPLRRSPALTATLAGDAKEGQQISVLARTKKGDWYQVRIGQDIAYLHSDFLHDWEAKKLSKTMIVMRSAPLRRSPAPTATLAGKAEEGQQVQVMAQAGGWYQVRAGRNIAYLKTDFLQDWRATKLEKTMVVAQDGPLFRSPSPNTSLADNVKVGQKIQVLAKASQWYQVAIGKNVAYVPMKYLRDLRCRPIVRFRYIPRKSTVRKMESGMGRTKSRCRKYAKEYIAMDLWDKCHRLDESSKYDHKKTNHLGPISRGRILNWDREDNWCEVEFTATCTYKKKEKYRDKHCE